MRLVNRVLLISAFALCLAALTLGSAPARFAGRAQKAARVTEVQLKPDEARSAGPCPVTVSFRGHITTDGPGTVTYTFTRSDGAVGPSHTLEFKEAGTQPLSTTWTLGDAQSSAPYENWLAVRVLSPNEVESSREAGRFVLTCGAARTDPAPEKQIDEKRSVGKRLDRLAAVLAEKGRAKLSEAQAAEKKEAPRPEKVAPVDKDAPVDSAGTDEEKPTEVKGTSASAAGAPGRLTKVIPDTPSPATSVNPNATQPTIYLADSFMGKVFAFRDMDGSGLTELNHPPAGTFAALVGDSLTSPNSVAVDPAGRIYVATRGERIVRVDDMSGANWKSLRGNLTSRGSFSNSPSGGFRSVGGLFVDSSYRIYVADPKSGEIVRFDDMDGTGRVAFRGSGDQRLLVPTGVTVDDAGRIYIADTGNHRIVRIDDMTGAGWVSCCGVDSRDPKTGLVQDSEELLRFPLSIALDARGRIYIITNPSTPGPLREAEGTPIYEINPIGPEVTHYSVVRIDDMTGAGRVSYSRQLEVGERGDASGVNQFAGAVSIALDRAGRIYIADSGNGRFVRTDDLTGAGWVAVPTFNCILRSPSNCTPSSIVVSDVRRPGTLPPPEDLAPRVYITSTPGAEGRSNPFPFSQFSPVVSAVISEDVGLRSVSVQLDDGPLMPMPFSRDPEDGTLYHGQLREVRPSPTAAFDYLRVHTLRVIATDTAGRTGEDLRRFHSADYDSSQLALWLDAADVHSYSGLVNGLRDHRSDELQILWIGAGLAKVVERGGQRAINFTGVEHGSLIRRPSLAERPGSLIRETPLLAGKNYTIFAVVQRESARGENYAIAQAGTGCSVGGCDANSSLHLGWLNERTVRFSQYYNDLDLTDVPAFKPSPTRSLIVARAGATTKYVSLDEPGFSKSAEKRDSARLRPSGPIGLGGSFQWLDPPIYTGSNLAYPRGENPVAPAFRFEGSIFEVMIYDEALTDEQMNRVKLYLKAKYGI